MHATAGHVPGRPSKKLILNVFSDFAYLYQLVAGVHLHSSHYVAGRPWKIARENCLEFAAYAEEMPGALRQKPTFTLARR
jgi:hypothetical protein